MKERSSSPLHRRPLPHLPTRRRSRVPLVICVRQHVAVDISQASGDVGTEKVSGGGGVGKGDGVGVVSEEGELARSTPGGTAADAGGDLFEEVVVDDWRESRERRERVRKGEGKSRRRGKGKEKGMEGVERTERLAQMVVLLHRETAETRGGIKEKGSGSNVPAGDCPALAKSEEGEAGRRRRQRSTSRQLRSPLKFRNSNSRQNMQLNAPEDVLVAIAEHKPELVVLEHDLGEDQSVEMASLVPDHLTSFLLPLVPTLDPQDAPNSVAGTAKAKHQEG